jgi:gluconokinase
MPIPSDAEIWLDALRLVLVEAAAVVVTTGPSRAWPETPFAPVRDVVFVELVGRDSVGEPLTEDEAGFRVAAGADLQVVVDRIADLLTAR